MSVPPKLQDATDSVGEAGIKMARLYDVHVRNGYSVPSRVKAWVIFRGIIAAALLKAALCDIIYLPTGYGVYYRQALRRGWRGRQNIPVGVITGPGDPATIGHHPRAFHAIVKFYN